MSRLSEWKREQLKKLYDDGYVEGPTGRRRRFALITPINIEDARKASVHAVVAGAASDLTLESLIILADMYRRDITNDEAKIITTVHDSILFEVVKWRIDEAAGTAKAVMEETAQRLFPQVPWKVDVEIGPSWGELSDYL